jgi:hypothetical protein
MTPTKPLNDDQLDAMLGRYLRAEAEVIGVRAAGERIATDALRRRVGRPAKRRSWMLLAAAVLLTSAAALGLAVGSATLRDEADSTAPRPSSVTSAIRTGGECEGSVPGTWVVYGHWRDELGRATELVIHEDGSVIRRVDPSDWEQGPLTVRVLTPSGVDLVRSAVVDGVDGGCATIRVPDARPHTVVARGRTLSGVGDLAGFTWGMPFEPPLLPATAEHQQIVTTLGERIEDLAAWLPPSAWVDPIERPYVGQWLIDIQQRYRGPDASEPAGPDPTGTDLIADPQIFATYGRKVLGTPDGPPTEAMTVAPERCQLSDAERAADIRSELERSGALPPSAATPGWRYTVPADPAYDVIVQLVALRPGELSCLDYSKAPEAEAPAPPTSTSTVLDTPRTDLTVVCRWLDLSWSRPPSPRTVWHEPCRR